jgi:hypothetical protein
MSLEVLARHLTLGSLLEDLRARRGGYEVITHWQQGEFHHDTVLRVDAKRATVPGNVLVVATNCNGGIKEILCFGEAPTQSALWHRRCPGNREFSGELPALLGRSQTIHWFDPCELLVDDARSEYREEFRERQSGGGWRMKSCDVKA